MKKLFAIITVTFLMAIGTGFAQGQAGLFDKWIFHTNPTSDSTENLPLVPLKTSHFFS